MMTRDKKPWVEDLQIEAGEYDHWISQKSSGESVTSWALHNQKIPTDIYLNWARNYYKIPSIKPEFFQKEPSLDFWNQVSTVYSWSESIIPLQMWDGVMLVACLEPPEHVQWSFPTQFLLAPPRELKSYWDRLQVEVTANFKQTPQPPVLEQDPSSADEDPFSPAFESDTSEDLIEAIGDEITVDGSSLQDVSPIEDNVIALGSTDHPAPSAPSIESTISEATLESQPEPDAPAGMDLNLPPAAKSNNPADNLLSDEPVEPTAEAGELEEDEPAPPPDGLSLDLDLTAAPETQFNFDSLKIQADEEVTAINTPSQPTKESQKAPAQDANELLKTKIVSETSSSEPTLKPTPPPAHAKVADDLLPTDVGAESLGHSLDATTTHVTQVPTHTDKDIDGFTAIGIDGHLDVAPESVSDAKTEGQIAAFFFKRLKTNFSKCMILLLETNQIKPWKWDGDWPRVSTVENVSLADPSIFRIVFRTKLPFHGPVSNSQTNEIFFKKWGYETDLPAHITLCPLSYDGHMVGMVLCAGEKIAQDLQTLEDTQRITEEMAIAMQKLNRSAA